MRILLINSPYQFRDKTIHRTELLGLEYLAGALRRDGFQVFIYDPTLCDAIQLDSGLYYYGEDAHNIIGKIREIGPDYVGISCHYSFASKEAYKIAKMCKEINDKIVVIMGGVFVSVFQERPIKECSAIDYCLIGESEKSFSKLLTELPKPGVDLAKIDGLIYRKNGIIIKNLKCDFIEDLNSLSFPARDLVDIKSYMRGSEVKKLYGLGAKPALSILTSRACPYRCSFCNMWMSHGSKWRSRSPDNIISEIDEITNKYSAGHVFIMDDNFTYSIDRAKSICSKILEKGIRFRWNTPNGISVKKIDQELADLMKRSGCANVCVAIESGSEYLRNVVMNKKVSNNEISEAVNCFNKADIPVVGYIMLGIPGEDNEHFMETVRFLKKIRLTAVVVSFAVPFPGTQLCLDLIGKGIIESGDKIDEIQDFNTPIYSTIDFTKDDLIERKKIIKDMFPSLAVLEKLEEKYCIL